MLAAVVGHGVLVDLKPDPLSLTASRASIDPAEVTLRSASDSARQSDYCNQYTITDRCRQEDCRHDARQRRDYHPSEQQ